MRRPLNKYSNASAARHYLNYCKWIFQLVWLKPRFNMYFTLFAIFSNSSPPSSSDFISRTEFNVLPSWCLQPKIFPIFFPNYLAFSLYSLTTRSCIPWLHAALQIIYFFPQSAASEKRLLFNRSSLVFCWPCHACGVPLFWDLSSKVQDQFQEN